MASCCWHEDFQYEIAEEVTTWSRTTEWVDLLAMFSAQSYFTGIPDFVRGNVGLLAWRVYASAVAQYVESYFQYQHTGRPDGFRYSRSTLVERLGGVHPVVVMVVPDRYMAEATPTWNNRFHLSSALDYTDRDLESSIPEQVKQGGYYQDFITARNQGLHGLTSELDIDINLSFVYFPQLEWPGGTLSHVATFLTRFGGALNVDFRVNIPGDPPSLEGRVTPIITVSYATWVAAVQDAAIDDVIATMARSAGPAPPVSDLGIVRALNRIYPQSNEGEIDLLMNGESVGWDGEDWQDDNAVALMQANFAVLPVQLWSAPNAMMEVQSGT